MKLKALLNVIDMYTTIEIWDRMIETLYYHGIHLAEDLEDDILNARVEEIRPVKESLMIIVSI